MPDGDKQDCKLPQIRSYTEEDTWPAALRWVAVAFVKNLGFICLKTVPFMLLAGLLGALLKR